MSNTIAASPNVLAEQVLAGLRGRLAILSAVSTNLTPTATGKTMQVSLVSGGAAKEYSKANGGYHEADDANLSAATVTLKHLHSTKAFSPDEISEYGEAYMVNAFVPEAINALVKKVHAEMGALILNANYSANEVITAANFNYAQVVDLNTDLNDAKAGDPRSLILSGAYAGAIRKDATLTSGSFNGAGAAGPLVSTGVLGQVVGFNIYEFTDLPTNSENLGGFAMGADAIVAGFSLPNASMFPGEVSQAADASGLSVQVLKSQGTDGIVRFTASIRAGFGVGRAGSLKRIKTA
jgi:hypothetical protein